MTAPDPASDLGPLETAGGRVLEAAALVLDITTAAAGERGLDAILRATLDRLRGIVAFTGGSIALVEGDDLVIRAAIGPFEAEALGQRLARGSSRSWTVVRERVAVRIDDLQDPGTPGTAIASPQLRSWLAVPIERHGLGVGLLEVDSVEPGAFAAADERLLGTIARALAGPIDLAARYADEDRARTLRDAFVGIVSHELRTPITTIYGMSRLLRQRLDTIDPSDLARSISDIEAEADRLRRLTEDLLVLTRAEGGTLRLATEPLIVRHLLRRVVNAERTRWPEHRFVLEASGGLPLVQGEDLYLEQVLRNLLGNAAKYSPPATTITVSAAAEDDGVAVRVIDEGPGLGAEPPERLFELFYRTLDATRHAPGAGIGLFVSRELVVAMGGRIWARPAPGRGAEFGFWLPRPPDDAPAVDG
ncbi:MAG: ATP-binding protein [Candidatus Limnocylindria bacterium]